MGKQRTLDQISERRRTRRVAYTTIIGTTIEWYDFFICTSDNAGKISFYTKFDDAFLAQ